MSNESIATFKAALLEGDTFLCESPGFAIYISFTIKKTRKRQY
ncbi:MAG: hypothetical protein RLT30_00420 [Gammaproteobacteria bacterium]